MNENVIQGRDDTIATLRRSTVLLNYYRAMLGAVWIEANVVESRSVSVAAQRQPRYSEVFEQAHRDTELAERAWLSRGGDDTPQELEHAVKKDRRSCRTLEYQQGDSVWQSRCDRFLVNKQTRCVRQF